VEKAAAEVLEVLARPFELGGVEVAISGSVGLAFAGEARDADDLFRNASIAVHAAKNDGGGRWQRYRADMHGYQLVQQRSLWVDLGQAVARDELVVRYQPIVALAGLSAVGFEALVRWRHPTRGLIGPGEFIPVAEESGLIVPVGNHVLSRALAAAARWQRMSLPFRPSPYVSVNVSTAQVRQPEFADLVRRELEASRLPEMCLMLEITESVLLRDDDTVWANLSALRDAGVRVAIDDFGTGYSSLSYLRRMPVDTLKIDRAFVEASTVHLLSTIVSLAGTLGLTVIAEGIETPAERDAVRAAGCEVGQGYLFAPALDEEDTWPWLAGGLP
jgi:EAL domain-containing protein (putative c-di-GMP-specific phosphodiesterase class I)